MINNFRVGRSLRELAELEKAWKLKNGIYRIVKLKNLGNNERGLAIVEILVALALMGTAGACFLSSLTTTSKSTISTDTHSTSDSLAISQIEYTIAQSYDYTNNPPQYALLSDIPNGWSVHITAERLDPDNDGLNDDDGIQEITVTVDFGSKQIVELTSRKVNISYEH